MKDWTEVEVWPAVHDPGGPILAMKPLVRWATTWSATLSTPGPVRSNAVTAAEATSPLQRSLLELVPHGN